MRRIPSILAAVSTLLVLSAVPAHAAGCPSLTDPAGDTVSSLDWTGLPLPDPGPWDVVSADVSTGPTSLVAVVRLASLGHTDDLDRTVFVLSDWLVSWRLGGVRHTVRFNPFGLVAAYDYTGSSGEVEVPVTVDRTAGTVSWQVPRGIVPGLVSGATLSDLTAFASYLSTTVDSAAALGAFHTDGTPGCIAAP